jgi:hypothetical protein
MNSEISNCRVWYYFTDIFPVTFHAAAILLTVCLAGQRCLCAVYPLSIAQWFTTKVTLVIHKVRIVSRVDVEVDELDLRVCLLESFLHSLAC